MCPSTCASPICTEDAAAPFLWHWSLCLQTLVPGSPGAVGFEKGFQLPGPGSTAAWSGPEKYWRAINGFAGFAHLVPQPCQRGMNSCSPTTIRPQVQTSVEMRSPGDDMSLLLPCGDPALPGRRYSLAPSEPALGLSSPAHYLGFQLLCL